MYKNKTPPLSLLLLAVIFAAVSSFAQYNNFRYYSIEEGLSQSNIFTVIQDSRGYLWLGTDGGGVSRFDGTKFRHFAKKNGLLDNSVRTIVEDSKGFLWFGTMEGISVYDGLRFFNITKEKGLSSNKIIKLFEDSRKNMWAGTADGGLNKIQLLSDDSVQINSYTAEHGLSSEWIFDIYEDSKHRLWLATYNGGITILSFKDTVPVVEYLKSGFDIPSAVILAIEGDAAGNIWCGTQDAGAFMIRMSGPDSGKVKTFNPENSGLPDHTIWDILCDRNGSIWFGTNESGTILYDGKSFMTYSTKNGFPNNQVLDVFEDAESNIWFGSFGHGLCRLTGYNFSHYTTSDGLPGEQVYGIREDRHGNYWLATYGGGLVYLHLANNIPHFTSFTSKHGLPDNNLRSVALDSRGYIWLATAEHGISRYDGKKFINLSEKDGLINNNINCIFVDSKDNVWCGTQGGISKLDSIGFRNMNEEKDGLINNEVQTIIEDKQGYLWFGTMGGLARMKGKTMTTYDEVEGLYDKRIYALAEDSIGNIWIGTFGGGLYKFDVSKDTLPIQVVANDAILSSNNIYSLVFPDAKTLLVATDKGFDKLSLSASGNIIQARNYNKTDGFIAVENNLNAILKDTKGDIWFGTVKGLSRYTSSLENNSKLPPMVHITDIRLFFESIDWGTKTDSITPWFNLPFNLSLPYFNNHLTFRFAGISLINPSRVKYRYMLEGVDEDWSPSRSESEVVYSGLSHGEYIFKVIAENENGVWNQAPTTLSFVITPPFWRTWWFYSLCALMAGTVIYTYIKMREKKLKEEKEILERLVVERTREVVQKKEEIEEKNKTLQHAFTEITHQKEVIEEKNKDILDSITYAQRIQNAILPADKSVNEWLQDGFVLFKPRDIVSGDFYWLEQKEEKIFFSSVDCTGHGVPGAFVSIVGANGLNRSVNEFGLTEPAGILDKLTKLVEETFRRHGTDIKDGMDIALCMYNRNTGILQFSGANNPMYLIRKKSSPQLTGNTGILKPDMETEEIVLYEITADKQPIGAYDFRKPFTNHEFKLCEGDTVYLSTDGFPDQFGGLKGKKFMYKSFKKVLLSLYNKPMPEQKEILNITIENWMKEGNAIQIDDISVVGMRI